MADKFVALGIQAALPVLKNYDVYLDKAKNNPYLQKIKNNPAMGKAEKNSNLKKAGDFKRGSLDCLRPRVSQDERNLSDHQARSTSSQGKHRQKYSSDYDSATDNSSSYDSDHRGSPRSRRGLSGYSLALPPSRRRRPSSSDYESGTSRPPHNRRAQTPSASKPENSPTTHVADIDPTGIGSHPYQPKAEQNSSDEERTLNRKRRHTMVLSGLAAVATVHAAGSIYGNVQASQAREAALRNGTLEPKEARKQRAKHLAHDVASLAVVGLSLKGLQARWQGAMGQRKQLSEQRAGREKRRWERKIQANSETDGEESGTESRRPSREHSDAYGSGRRPGMNRYFSYSESDLPSQVMPRPAPQTEPLMHTSTLPTPNIYGATNHRYVPPPPPVAFPSRAPVPSRAREAYTPAYASAANPISRDWSGQSIANSGTQAPVYSYPAYNNGLNPSAPSMASYSTQSISFQPPTGYGAHPTMQRSVPMQAPVPTRTYQNNLNPVSPMYNHGPAAFNTALPRAQTFPLVPSDGSMEDSTYGSIDGAQQQAAPRTGRQGSVDLMATRGCYWDEKGKTWRPL